jgi:hypothetical protein
MAFLLTVDQVVFRFAAGLVRGRHRIPVIYLGYAGGCLEGMA